MYTSKYMSVNNISRYSHHQVENKWREKWQKSGLYAPDIEKAKKPFFNLMMFPYMSAEGLHVGNAYAFIGADVFGRYQRMHGYDVFEPIGVILFREITAVVPGQPAAFGPFQRSGGA